MNFFFFFYRISEFMLATLIQRCDKKTKTFHFKNERLIEITFSVQLSNCQHLLSMEDYRLPAGAVGSLKALSLSGFPVWSVQQGEENTILTVTCSTARSLLSRSQPDPGIRPRYPGADSRNLINHRRLHH